MDPGPNSKGKNYLVGQSLECSEYLLIHSRTLTQLNFIKEKRKHKGLEFLILIDCNKNISTFCFLMCKRHILYIFMKNIPNI